MDCYKLVGGTLQPVQDPTDAFAEQCDSVEGAINMAGYTVRACSSQIEGNGAEISIYESENREQPRYYIDVMGTYQSIASLVADDFPSLLATLKELQPPTALIGLEQRAWIQAEESLEPGARRGAHA